MYTYTFTFSSFAEWHVDLSGIEKGASAESSFGVEMFCKVTTIVCVRLPALSLLLLLHRKSRSNSAGKYKSESLRLSQRFLANDT